MSGSTGNPPAGWYDDPLVPGGKRYWDGQRWTEAVGGPVPMTPPGASVGGPVPAPDNAGSVSGGEPLGTAPPFGSGSGWSAPGGGYPAPGGVSVAGSGNRSFNDLGEWLNRTFSVMWTGRVPIAIIWLLPVPFWVAAVLAARQAASRVTWNLDINDFELSEVSTLAIALPIGLSVVALIVTSVSYLGGHHQLYGAHVGRPTSWTQSLQVGLTRQPRFIALAVLSYLVTYLAIGAPIGLFLYALLGENQVNGSLLMLSLFGGLLAAAFLIWFWVKVRAFIAVAAAVVPRGSSAFVSATAVSRGWFWPILIRLAIVTAVVGTVATIVQITVQTLSPLVLFSKVEITDSGLVLVNGRDIETIDVLQLGDLLPNPFLLAVFLVLVFAFTAATQAVSASAHAALYADAGAPNSFGHSPN